MRRLVLNVSCKKKLADCLQSAFFRKIRSVLIQSYVTVNNEVTVWVTRGVTLERNIMDAYPSFISNSLDSLRRKERKFGNGEQRGFALRFHDLKINPTMSRMAGTPHSLVAGRMPY